MALFNRTPRLADWADPTLSHAAVDLMNAESPDYLSNYPQAGWGGVHRKWWEWAMALVAAEHFGLLAADRTALAIGAGHEPPIYAFANSLRMTVATDLYGQTAFEAEAASEILRNPAAFAHMDYDERGLLVADMDACAIPFADNSFDMVFSLSSLEHFGDDASIVRAMKEARRVLRPHGPYLLATEYLFDEGKRPVPREQRVGALGETFTRREVVELLVEAPGFALAEPIDFQVEAGEITNVFDTETWTAESRNFLPHVWLRQGDAFFTSLFLVLWKR